MPAKKKVIKDNPTEGNAPLLTETPTVEINGETYELRRLGVRDTFAIARIISVGASAMGKDGVPSDASPEVMARLMLNGVLRAEGHALNLMASVIDVDPKDLEDPEKFPMDAVLTIGEGLAKHQDLKAFFTSLVSLMTRLPEMTQSKG